MDKSQLDSIATAITGAYLDSLSYSRVFRDDHGQPPTSTAKAHNFRSIVQSIVNLSDTLVLAEPYVELGRVEIKDLDTGHRYLLRSASAVAIESSRRQGALFDSTKYLRSDVILLVYVFHDCGVDLSIAGTRSEPGSKRLEPTGEPTLIGTWPFASDEATGFDQGDVDGFGELGDEPGEIEDDGE